MPLANARSESYKTKGTWLESMADQVVIAIQYGLMTSQLQSFSVTEERVHIAREMHDGLTQVLGYMNLQVQTLDALLQQGKLEKLREKLAQMRDAVQVAHADVRENIGIFNRWGGNAGGRGLLHFT
jgi:nitrate/nitrite-specific signal transduction histidine kinase